MPIFNFTETYADNNPLFELDLDNLRASIEIAINETGLDSVNIATPGLSKDSFQDPSIFVRAGVAINYSATTPPVGWLLCDGASYLVSAYPELFAAIGYTHGGAGANFNVPDCGGRVSLAADDLGGTAANRVTTAVSGGTPDVLGSALGGEDLPEHLHNSTAIQTTASEGAHTHDYGGSHTHLGNLSSNYVDKGYNDGGGTTLTNTRSGNFEYVPTRRATYPAASTNITIPASSGAHTHAVTGGFTIANNTNGASTPTGVVQPTIILAKIIKT